MLSIYLNVILRIVGRSENSKDKNMAGYILQYKI